MKKKKIVLFVAIALLLCCGLLVYNYARIPLRCYIPEGNWETWKWHDFSWGTTRYYSNEQAIEETLTMLNEAKLPKTRPFDYRSGGVIGFMADNVTFSFYEDGHVCVIIMDEQHAVVDRHCFTGGEELYLHMQAIVAQLDIESQT